jgi:hypothetical protein
MQNWILSVIATLEMVCCVAQEQLTVTSSGKSKNYSVENEGALNSWLRIYDSLRMGIKISKVEINIT